MLILAYLCCNYHCSILCRVIWWRDTKHVTILMKQCKMANNAEIFCCFGPSITKQTLHCLISNLKAFNDLSSWIVFPKVFRKEVGSKSPFRLFQNISFWLQRLSDPALLSWDYLQKKSPQPQKSESLRAHFLSKHFTL